MKRISKLAYLLPIAATTISYAAGFDINSARNVTLQDIQEYYEMKAEEESNKRVELKSSDSEENNIRTSQVAEENKEKKILAITAVSSLEQCIGKKGKVISDFENYRTSPWGNIIGQIAKDIEVKITGVDGDWFIIDMGGGDAYIHSKWVKVDGFNRTYPDDGTVSEDVKAYDADGYELGELNAGDDIEILADCGTYWKFKFEDKEAYVVKSLIDTDIDGDDEPSEENKANDTSDNDSDDDGEEVAADSDDNEEANSTSLATTTGTTTSAKTSTESSTSTSTQSNSNNSSSAKVAKNDAPKESNNTVKFTSPTANITTTNTSTSTNSTKTSTKTSSQKSSTSTNKTSKSSTTSSASNNNQYISNLGALLSPGKVTTSVYKKQSIGSNWDTSGENYTHVQGICCDGTYFYIALMTSAKNGDYRSQYTKILKMNMSTKKIVKAKRIGKIGHSNSLCYNTKNKKIYSATCTNKMTYWCEIDTDLSGYKKIYPKDKNGKKYTNKCFASFSYDPVKDQYVVKMSNKSFGFFDQNFKLIKTVSAQNMKISDSMTGQAIYTDGKNIFSQCGNLKSRPTVNYILCYDMNGKYIQKISLSKLGSVSEHAELEQLTGWKGKYYIISNCSGFRIHSIKLRK